MTSCRCAKCASGSPQPGDVEVRHPPGPAPHLGERDEHESALDHARMRKRQLRVAGLLAFEEQYIDVERARAEAEGPDAPVFVLDPLALPQQGRRLQAGLETDDLVEEGALVLALLWRGLVNAGRGEHTRGGQSIERVARGTQIPRPVAEVGSQRHERTSAAQLAGWGLLGARTGGVTARTAHAVRTTSTRAAWIGSLTGGASLLTATSTKTGWNRSHSPSQMTVASRSRRWNSPPSTTSRT
mgnify:CR=1 FL=1